MKRIWSDNEKFRCWLREAQQKNIHITKTATEVEERIKNRKKELDSSNKELNTVKQKLGQERKKLSSFGIVRKMTNQKVKVKTRPHDRK
ncbi:hypothetical protein GLOIN_2v1498324 [Rhizophagus irregularis DAOM 181602=DAOM 197198]|uniref:Uncharacterized protein n=1 Tax=Rhizophagus irregularis (strain DAOM 181602 / DAOM 197198 / MUCL 43194) TaxID=747089 RepID=A0A2P4QXW0_RHIID|nr:hypothetical protein GLOIN_2v1498324 [Rhizophagus irregularis DAOM 181602=DAOM 197198]POG82408.1 hypothetical protein GLOIN_2v1498324 [Rhizophagus irregularis DAOM 181602=DAOM 197198]GET66584.1 hypothetical protein GLOIN_2v1498324 [Rhizophagus irregularis DAOM 181602=DAOM 197198]|eukprot:XP_025189274.1 hypothetical protein GLOIN_2v1498324 [Rhizophagus irregularis DAOM 181602=DAOM 197198]